MAIEWFIIDGAEKRIEGPFSVPRMPGTDRLDYSELRGRAVILARRGICVAIVGYRPSGEASYLWPRVSFPRMRPYWYKPRVDLGRVPRSVFLSDEEMAVLRRGGTIGQSVWSLVHEDAPYLGKPPRIGEPRIRQVSVCQSDWDRLGELGGGSHNLGLRRLIYPLIPQAPGLEEEPADPNLRILRIHPAEVAALRTMGTPAETVAWAVRELAPAPWIANLSPYRADVKVPVSDADYDRLVLYGFGDAGVGLRRLLVAML